MLSYITRGNYTIERLSKIILTPDTYYWFLWVLFWIFVLFWAVQRMAYRWKMKELAALWMTAGLLMVMMVGLNTRYLGFRFIAYYFFFYVLGYSLHKLPILQINNKMMIAVLTLIWIGLAWGWSMHELPPYMSVVSFLPSSLMLYTYRGITAIVAIEVIFYAAPRLLNQKNKMNKVMASAGVLSLGIYTTHILLLDVTKPLCLRLMQEIGYAGTLVVVFVAASLISLAIVACVNRNKAAARLLLGKV